MKKSITKFLVWAVVTYVFLYLATSGMLALSRNNNLLFEHGGMFKQYFLMILIFIVLGILLGIFVRIIKDASVITYVLATLYGLYFSGRFVMYFFVSRLLYPRCFLQNTTDFTTPFGGMLLGLVLLEVFRKKTVKFTWLNKIFNFLMKYKWRLLLSIAVITTVSVIVYTPPQEKVVNECMELMYSVPSSDYVNTIGEKEQQAYAELCTEFAYDNIVGRDLHLLFAKAGNKGGFSIELKNLALETSIDLSANTGKERRFYNYEAELLLTFDDTGEVQIIYEKGSINIEKVEGKWRVSNVGFKDLDEIFK